MSHTPGPWRFGQNHAQRKNGSRRQWSIGLAADPLDHLGVTGCSPIRESDDYMLVTGFCREADARLIAAAPDLLTALQEAERFMAYFAGETGETFVGPGTPRSSLQTIRAALSKATPSMNEGK